MLTTPSWRQLIHWCVSFFRKDPFGPAWVLISPERGLVPSDFGTTHPSSDRSPLSPGNETKVGREIVAVRPAGSKAGAPDWRVRVIEHPAGMLDAKRFTTSGEGVFVQGSASGFQEIVIEHPNARMRWDAMPSQHLVEVLKVYRDRLTHLGSKPGIRHVQVSRNVGVAAGALYEHPHAQVLAIPVTSRWLNEEIQAAADHRESHGTCLFCDVVAAELTAKERIISQNDEFVAIAPYAAKTPFETWVVPRSHESAFSHVASNALPALAEMLKTVVTALSSALDYPPYNFVIHTLPHAGEAGFHWHIEFLPRLTQQAGFDWGSGFYVNPTPPEVAARFLREALALREVAP